ncbi:MAG TPA: hypothetical protein VE826_04225 [Dongiaceae bacterium]|jgi:hypothetical protein|nr:hypothetical protein [Dongiaceae bacterium]
MKDTELELSELDINELETRLEMTSTTPGDGTDSGIFVGLRYTF